MKGLIRPISSGRATSNTPCSDTVAVALLCVVSDQSPERVRHEDGQAPALQFEPLAAFPASQLLVDTLARDADQLADVALCHFQFLRRLGGGLVVQIQERLGEAGFQTQED